MEDYLASKLPAERIAEGVLEKKGLLTEYGRRTALNQSGISHLRKEKKTKVWMYSGSQFFSFGKSEAQEILRKDQERLKSEASSLREAMKKEVGQLEKEEGTEQDSRPFQELRALSPADLMLVSALASDK